MAQGRGRGGGRERREDKGMKVGREKGKKDKAADGHPGLSSEDRRP